MRRIHLFITFLLFSFIAQSQTVPGSLTDSISLKVIHYLQVQQPDSIYNLVGKNFRDKISQENFKAICVNQLFPLNDFKNVVYVSNNGGINKYKVSGAPDLQLLIGLNSDKKIETFLVQPYAEEKNVVEDNPSFVTDSLDTYINTAMAKWQIPALSLCIIKNGRPVVIKGYGFTELGGANKVDENTLFMIGSNTKAFTATALAMLANQKKLSLDDKVTKWLPAFRLQNQAAGEQSIIRDLLCHRLGFETFQGDFTYWTSNLSRDEVIAKMSKIKAVHPFRTTWGYTNAAFVTAGQIIPKVTGMEWEDFIRQSILLPLGMTRTLTLSKDLPEADNKATPYTVVEGKLVKIPYCQIDNLAPAGSISSSVSDMSKWVTLQLASGMFDGKQLIPAGVIAQTRLPHSIIGKGGTQYNKGHYALYGLGWELQEYENREIVSHTGGVNGYVSSVTLIPEESLGIVILTNTDQNMLFEALKMEIVDAYLKLKYRDYSNGYLRFDKLKQAQAQKESKKLRDSAALKIKAGLPLAAYSGKYMNDVYGTMQVAVDGSNLKMMFSHHPNMFAKLESLGGNRFYATFSDPAFATAIFPFRVADKKVKSVAVKVADFIEYTPYEFSKIN